ncbi:hypothetical protein F4806DRAFT_1360 [Annulohypoxylon nitens]|nr:hypothetical protein F4806DRAFT_1360 [Annulohypoxylon nitens]
MSSPNAAYRTNLKGNGQPKTGSRCWAATTCDGMPLTGDVLCQFHRSKVIEEQRKKRGETQICNSCSEPALPGKQLCAHHVGQTNRQQNGKRENREISRAESSRAGLQRIVRIAQTALDNDLSRRNASSNYYGSQPGSSSQPGGSGRSSNREGGTSNHRSSGNQGSSNHGTQGRRHRDDRRR